MSYAPHFMPNYEAAFAYADASVKNKLEPHDSPEHSGDEGRTENV